MMNGLVGKKAVITGAAGGIGKAISRLFAEQGASVVVAGRHRPNIEQALQELEGLKPSSTVPADPPSKHDMHLFNVRNLDGWKGLVKAHRNIDILVNCAGATQDSLLIRTKETDTEHLLETNLTSVIWGCRMVGKQMVGRRQGGCIINISSLLAHRAAIGTSIYTAAKAGQLGLTTALSQEFGHYGIRVNAIVPGYIATEMTKSLAKKDELIKKIPLERFGTPAEVAHAALFLAENSYANNCILNLDGGLSAV